MFLNKNSSGPKVFKLLLFCVAHLVVLQGFYQIFICSEQRGACYVMAFI